jgi:hypothetical protein
MKKTISLLGLFLHLNSVQLQEEDNFLEQEVLKLTKTNTTTKLSVKEEPGKALKKLRARKEVAKPRVRQEKTLNNKKNKLKERD